jgi:tRNA(Ile2) C34 agmatinyltransferase TiaS
VVVNATAQDYVNTTDVTVGATATGGGLIGGASSTGILAFAAVVGGLAYAYREDYL